MGYVPDRGDAVWLTFNPQAGHEQAGRRPGLVLSPALYNGRAQLALICPITSQDKGYPYHVAIPAGLKVTGFVQADQIKSLDWGSRQIEFITKLPDELTQSVLEKLATLLQV